MRFFHENHMLIDISGSMVQLYQVIDGLVGGVVSSQTALEGLAVLLDISRAMCEKWQSFAVICIRTYMCIRYVQASLVTSILANAPFLISCSRAL